MRVLPHETESNLICYTAETTLQVSRLFCIGFADVSRRPLSIFVVQGYSQSSFGFTKPSAVLYEFLLSAVHKLSTSLS